VDATTGTFLSAEQLLTMPEARKHVELVAGVLRRMTPTGGAHGSVASRLLAALSPYVFERNLGELFTAEAGFILRRGPDTVRCPDVAFVAADRLPPEGLGRGFLELAPDLAAEVLSPSDSASEMNAKVEEYLRVGVRLVWDLDPETRTITVHDTDGTVRRLRESDVLEGGSVVPGFRCPVAALFAGVRRE
jgi:Uma2 family endonuclease